MFSIITIILVKKSLQLSTIGRKSRNHKSNTDSYDIKSESQVKEEFVGKTKIKNFAQNLYYRRKNISSLLEVNYRFRFRITKVRKVFINFLMLFWTTKAVYQIQNYRF